MEIPWHIYCTYGEAVTRGGNMAVENETEKGPKSELSQTEQYHAVQTWFHTLVKWRNGVPRKKHISKMLVLFYGTFAQNKKPINFPVS